MLSEQELRDMAKVPLYEDVPRLVAEVRALRGERYVCSAQTPWTPEKGRAYHPDASEVGEHYDTSSNHDDYVIYLCPHCGKRFWETLPN